MKIENISTKVIRPGNHNEIIDYSIKCTVHNDTMAEHVRINLQGLDFDGFEIDTVTIDGTIPVGETKVMTTRTINSA